MRRRFWHLLSLGLVLLLGGIQISQANETTFFSRTYVREAGKPAEWQESINVPAGVAAPFRLVVQNGLEDGSARVSSAQVILGEAEVVRPSDLNQQVPGLERPVELPNSEVELRVRLTSNPGGQLSLSLAGTAVALGPQPPQDFWARAAWQGSRLLGSNDGMAELQWRPSPDDEVRLYRVYRGSRRDQLTLIGTVGAGEADEAGYFLFTDLDYELRTVAFYAVSAVDKADVEGPRTAPYATLAGSYDEPSESRLKKFDGLLNKLYILWEAGADVLQVAEDLNVPAHLYPPYAIGVVLTMIQEEPIPESYINQLRRAGIDVDAPLTLVSPDDILIRVPLEMFPVLEQMDIVKSVGAQSKGKRMQTASMAQLSGPLSVFDNLGSIKKLVGIDILHRRKLRGQGIGVGILDLHDDRHADISHNILAEVLPDAEDSRTIHDFGIILDQDHFEHQLGIAVASPGISVVAMPVGFGPSGDLAQRVDRLFARHPSVLGVVAAGNEAQGHDHLPMRDLTGEGLADLREVNYTDIIGLRPGEFLNVFVYSPENPSLTPGKAECGELKLDADLCPIRDTGVAPCQDLNMEKTEFLSKLSRYQVRPDDRRLRIQVSMGPKYVNASGQRMYCNDGRELHVLVSGGEDSKVKISGGTSERSITGIAAVSSVLTVGASTADGPPAKNDQVTDYSARGPAVVPAPLDDYPWSFDSGGSNVVLLKPELVAPGHYRTLSDNVHGTSYAVPWVAGAAGLLMQQYRKEQKTSTGSPQEAIFVREKLEDLATPLQGPRQKPKQHRPDWGYGRLDLRDHAALLGDRFEIYRITPDGTKEFIELPADAPYVFSLAAESGTGAVWYSDLLQNRIYRIDTDGSYALFPGQPGALPPDSYVEEVGFDPKANVCWVSVWVGPELFDYELYQLNYSPDSIGSYDIRIAGGPEKHTMQFYELEVDTERGNLWAEVERMDESGNFFKGIWVRSLQGSGKIRYELSGFGRPSFLAVDPVSGGAWTSSPSRGQLIRVPESGEAQIYSVNQRARDLSVDPQTGDLWATFSTRWARYGSAWSDPNDPNEPQAVFFPPASTPRLGQASPADSTFWALNSAQFPAKLYRLGPSGALITETPIMRQLQFPKLAPYVALPDMNDPNAPPPVVISAAMAPTEPQQPKQRPRSLWDVSPELGELEDEATGAGLSVGEWAREDIRNLRRFQAEARQWRESQQ